MYSKNHFSTQSNYPLITVGIPTYNRAALVKRCIEGVLAQTYPSIEVLVSDNASTDNTLAVLGAIGDDRLRILTSYENVGAVENFAKCIREARGNYLVLLSDDNFWVTDTFLERCAQMIKAEPGLPIVLAAYDVLDMDDFYTHGQRIVPAVLSKKLSTGIQDGVEIFKEFCRGKLSAGSLSVVVRTDILRNNNRYSKEYCHACDDATWMPALLEGRAGLINERCATYLVHGSSMSKTIAADDWIEDYKKLTEELSVTAVRKFPDQSMQHHIKKLALMYLAYQLMITLVIYRRAGASLSEIVQKLWNWRTILKQFTLMDIIAIVRLRSLGRILLPKPVARLSIAVGLDKLF
jgi:glycosyltransferase involved in cell wall biosynthesis